MRCTNSTRGVRKDKGGLQQQQQQQQLLNASPYITHTLRVSASCPRAKSPLSPPQAGEKLCLLSVFCTHTHTHARAYGEKKKPLAPRS
ncbi:hypothetical protein EYF80_031865 [Liparis tanakae]|uniref:Uncharacterized protein n=1 Tax=Liparis tanakae TaxID=230148 RepID=A0A4Z2GWX9_9TELE|nr:hypothetical protein EYF80_031865 [Liparis tanakae]